MTVSNLPIPPRPPRATLQKKFESLDRTTLLQQPYKTVSTSHRRVFSQHPHRALRGRITLSLPPPSVTIPVRSFWKLSCLPNKLRQPTAWHTHSIYFWKICTLYLSSGKPIFMSCRKLGEISNITRRNWRLLLSILEGQNLDLGKTWIINKKIIKVMPCHLYSM